MKLLGLQEFADVLGVTNNALGNWRRRGVRNIPEPIAELRCGPIWTWNQVMDYVNQQYARATEKLDGN